MRGEVEKRAEMLGKYILQNKSTVRAVAQKFCVSKSTVHKDVAERLKYINPSLYKEVKEVLATNKDQRHLRGGLATKKKYLRDAVNSNLKTS